MSHTNNTPKLQLAQFVASDKPTWLGDWNSTMLTIDNAVGTAQETIQTISGQLLTMQENITTVNTNVNKVVPSNIGDTGNVLMKTANGQAWSEISVATTSSNGLMSSADKDKLDNIQANANNVKIKFSTVSTGSVTTTSGKEVQVTDKPIGTVLCCLPLGVSGTLRIQGVPGSTLGNNQDGRFYVTNYGSTASTGNLQVIWLYV